MPATFEEDGIQFMYPDNWRLERHPQETDGLVCALTLESPSGALWTLNVEDGLRDIDHLASSVLATLKEEYPEAESEPYQGKWGELDTAGFELHFYVLEMVVKAVIQCLHFQNRTYMTLAQAETRDFDELAPIFNALGASIVQ